MKTPFDKSNGGEQSPASLFAALVLVALVPAVCVLWFMTVAMRNERLAFDAMIETLRMPSSLALMPFGNSNAESQRDSGLKPRVARNELPWEMGPWANNPTGVAARRRHRGATPLGLKIFTAVTQGSSFLATLGWKTQSLWDWGNPHN